MRLEDLQGRILGRYQITGMLGRGGMAAVYRAHDTALRRDVALKMLYPQYIDDTSLVERFQREAIMAAQLDHPNIVPIYDVGETDGMVYIAMRLLSGRSLADILREQKKLPPAELAPIIEQIASAIDYAHARGIVHRDIKPANIMIEGRRDNLPIAILTDFGIAKSLDSPSMTGTGVLIGTPDYMAPEQIRGDKTIDGRADIYALGALAFRCLTGRQPFEGSTQEVLIGHLEGHPIDLATIAPDLPTALGPLIRKAMARQPDQRYQTASEFARAFHTAAGLPTPTPPPAARRLDGRAVVPRIAADDLARRTDPNQATQKGDAAPPDVPPVPTPRVEQRRYGPWVLAAILIALVIGGAFFMSTRRSLNTGLISSPTALPATLAPTEQPAIVQPAEPPTPAPEPPTATLPPEPSPTVAPVSSPTRAAPTATTKVLPGATSSPTTTPTSTTAPPTITPTPCSVALVGGFGMLWAANPDIQQRIGCPIQTEQGGANSVAEQQFERGSMLYFNPLERIYVLIGVERGTWRLFEQRQLTPLPTPTPAPVPANGLIVPVRGFGLIWGTFADIRDSLGYATQPENGLIEGAYQPFEGGTMLYSNAGLGRGKSLYILYKDGTFERYDDPNR